MISVDRSLFAKLRDLLSLSFQPLLLALQAHTHLLADGTLGTHDVQSYLYQRLPNKISHLTMSVCE